MAQRQQMSAFDRRSDRLQSLAMPLAVGVFMVGATASLFRPAFTIGAPVAIVAAPAKPFEKIADARPVQRDDALTTGRSVDVGLSLPPEEVARMTARGKALMDAGDFAAARLLLARAADAGDADATFALASTYDPNILSQKGARGLTGDPAQAKTLYARALTAGVQDAKSRISALGG